VYSPKTAIDKLKESFEAGSVIEDAKILNPKEVEVEAKVLMEARTKFTIL
jgi:hypothetical protein